MESRAKKALDRKFKKLVGATNIDGVGERPVFTAKQNDGTDDTDEAVDDFEYESKHGTLAKFLEVARKELANPKDASEYRKWYSEQKGSDYSNADWCAIFVSYIAGKAGILEKSQSKYVESNELSILRTSGTTVIREQSIKAGRYMYTKNDVAVKSNQTIASNYTPKPGDLVLFRWGGEGKATKHVGIVNSVYTDSSGNKMISTIEGNTNNKVGSREILYNHSDIVGYVKNN